MLKFHILAVITLFLLTVTTVQSQDESHISAQSRLQGFRMLVLGGQDGIDPDDLNPSLRAAGLPRIRDTYFSPGGAIEWVSPLGFGSLAYLGPGGESDDDSQWDYTVSGFAFKFGFGIHVLSHRGFTAFPWVDLVIDGVTIHIEEAGSPDFSDVLQNPRRGVHLDQSTGGLQFGLGVNQALLLFGDHSNGPCLDVRAGYHLSFGKARWISDGTGNIDGPGFGYNGLAVQVAVGWSFLRPSNKPKTPSDLDGYRF